LHHVGCSRRALIRGSLATLATLATADLSWPAIANAADPADDTLQYVSRPDLRPPRVKLTRRPELPASPGYYLLTTEGTAAQHGLLIIDQNGDTVWFNPAPPGGLTKDLNVQEYRGEPVLTWWANTQRSGSDGIGDGIGFIADHQYNVLAHVAAGNGLKTDFHELNLTDRGTALITAYRSKKINQSKFGGSADSYAWSGVAQEIDIATGKVVFEWDSLDHVGLGETLHSFYPGTPNRPFDYFHINSVAVAHDNDLLISGRNTSTVYKVDRQTGEVKWRLGGRKSDFELGPGVRFWWQHHVREPYDNVLSVFDDAASPTKERQSRGILLELDTVHMRATLRRAYTSPARLLAVNQGSMQMLQDGRVLIGWGSEPAFTEFTSEGTELLNGELPHGDWTYRTFAAEWTGYPDNLPTAVALPSRTGGAVVYLSWNGATDVASWTVHAGTVATTLTPVASQPRTSFETAVFTPHNGPYFSADALDAGGRVLGRSTVVRC
jgi:Arylsulfotransferase (ASST)